MVLQEGTSILLLVSGRAKAWHSQRSKSCWHDSLAFSCPSGLSSPPRLFLLDTVTWPGLSHPLTDGLLLAQHSSAAHANLPTANGAMMFCPPATSPRQWQWARACALRSPSPHWPLPFCSACSQLDKSCCCAHGRQHGKADPVHRGGGQCSVSLRESPQRNGWEIRQDVCFDQREGKT